VDQFNTSGSLFTIIAANGTGFGFGFASGGGQIAETGGFFNVSSGGTMSGTLLDGTSLSGTLNTSSFTASGTFTVFVNGGVHSGTWSMSRQIPLPNRAPVAVNDSYQVAADKSLAVNSTAGVLSNDSDLEGDPLNANLSTGSSNGTVSLSANGGFTYTPNANFIGNDSFTYRASDGLATSNLATVTITVEPVKALPWLTLLLD